ncbi:hypothetical protein F5B22DRAFT_258264 [Xylaria bambusicola]|uniref:uncharacterized protein n=1 Tax=Xylaria bambusicola TaxID=326684 RepID=UPI00200856E0|nr:uncharacterized protein F5B22DRAFT_258264 [Xylaria bambusicola]KAI0525891.1 hypothetical protein F5B22DRAFT_258264 [Xylaria bambusicola]
MDAAVSTGNTASKKSAVKLIPKKLGVRGRWRKPPSNESFGSFMSTENEEDPSMPDSERGGSGPGSLSTHPTQSNTGDGDNADDAESTDFDATQDIEHGVRPAVPSTHPSQIGHLTTSSPIIQASHLPEVQALDQQETLESLSRAASFSAASSEQSLDKPRALSTSKTSLYPPSDSSSRRSRSPAGRIKDAFRGKRGAGASPTAAGQNGDHQGQEIPVGLHSRPSSAVSSQSDTYEPDLTSRGSRRRRKSQPPLEISVRPRTPPASNSPGPAIVNTPPTPVEYSPPKSRSSPFRNPNVVVSPSGNMISHRRARSGSATSIGPSKLSNIVSAPLTPTPENAVPSTPGAGFFSSMFSAAQNAANTLSSTITNTSINPGGNRPKSNSSKEMQPADDDRVEVESPAEEVKNSNTNDKEPAVKTLGMGDLSLSQLGFQETVSAAPTPTSSRFTKSATEQRARSESAPVDHEHVSANGDGPSDELSQDRPRSLYDDAHTTPPASVYEDGGVQRTSSIRSAISKTRRRKRGSTGGTAGTGTTIGAAIAAANASVAHPAAAGSAPKLTGFAVASKKRNRDFHVLFKSVPDDDYLIEDYSCALQREILAHGRLYVSEGHICFSSNILGWVTTLVMSFDEIVSVEKRSTALVFKNGLMISTLHAKHVFASFTSRDSTYDLIVNIWKLGHPTLRSSLNGVSLDETGGDKTEKVDAGEGTPRSQSGSESEEDDSEDDDDVYDEDLEEDDAPAESQPTETNGEKAVSRKVSSAMAPNGVAVDKPDATASSGTVDFPGPATHGPTECSDSADGHFEVPIADDTITAPLGRVYNLIFGPTSVTWMSKWLTTEQKCTDLQMEDKKGLTADNKSRSYSYTKPLYAPIGPKQTKCIVSETIEHFDLEKAVSVLVTTQTPDVPSGNLFTVKTKYCLSWAENNATRVTMNCTIEWTGKSWLKGAIEKGAKDGQGVFWKDLSASLKSAISSRPRAATLNGTTKGKKKKVKGKLNHASKDSLRNPADSTSPKTQDWGLLESLHGVLGPIVDILKPVMTGNVVYGLLVGLLVSTWFGFGFNSQQRGVGYGRGVAFSSYPDRAVAYEEIWRREESELWDWLEERVGLHRMNDGGTPIRKRVTEPRTIQEKLQEERMSEREVEEAIKITEEKLDVLKSVISRKKDIPKTKSEGEGNSIADTVAER